ncbi:MAG: hypothetical protein JXR76_03135 [Deltaproteobacteria bacterium]|nr:hypothetical protein [Deltaproteobacteria bacterium]
MKNTASGPDNQYVQITDHCHYFMSALCTFCLFLCVSTGAMAQTIPSSETPPARVSPSPPMPEEQTAPRKDTDSFSTDRQLVILTGFASAEDIHMLEQSIRSQLADLNTEVIFYPLETLLVPREKQDALFSGFMTAHNANMAFIVFPADSEVNLRIMRKTPNGIILTDRPVTATHGSPQHEALAVIIRSTILAIREQNEAPVPQTPPKSAKRGTPTPPARAMSLEKPPKSGISHTLPRHLFLEAAMAIGHFSGDTHPWPGVSIGVGVALSRHLLILAEYVFVFPLEKKTSDLSLKLERHPVYLGFAYIHFGKRLFWGGGLSFSADYVQERVTSQTQRLEASPNGAELNIGLFCHVLVGVAFNQRFRLVIQPGLEIPLNSTRYSVYKTQADTPFVKPLPVQPTLRIGFQFDFF